MYFYNITRIKKNQNIGEFFESLLNDETFLILPIIQPKSIYGQYLLNDEASAFLSEYSGKYANILYLAKNNIEGYSKFLNNSIKLIDEISNIKLNEPSIIVIDKSRENLFVYDEFQNFSNTNEFQKFNQKIINSIKSKKPITNLKLLKYRHEISAIDIRPFLQGVIKFFRDLVIEHPDIFT